jgi:NAD+-dependent protein deacetylase SIR2
MITLDLAQLSESTSPDDAPLRRTLTNISLLVAKSKKAVVVTGAGISCSCGVPVSLGEEGMERA